MYADDYSIFLTQKATSLQSAISILVFFSKNKWLKISISKTKAVWFGAGCHFTHQLCPEIPLVWDSEFGLLGIDFDNCLEKMERNFDKKLQEIKRYLISDIIGH